jgi:multicomponent Na+:H+ antiporter subunit G
MNIVLDLLSWICLVTGGAIILIGTIGMFRFPDFFTRLHAASLIDTLGSMLIVLGLASQAGLGLVTVKLLLIIFFILFTTPTAAHALAKAAIHGKLKPVLSNTGEQTSKSSST